MNRPVTWDSRNRLATLNSSPLESTPTAIAYRYDSQGNRYQKTVNGQSTYYATNSHGVSGMSEVCMEFRPDGKQCSYVWSGPGVGLLYEVRLTTGGADEGIRCYHTDQVGSTLALSDGNGTVKGRIEYSPYGFITRTEGVTDTPFLFCGGHGCQTDAETRLVLMRAIIRRRKHGGTAVQWRLMRSMLREQETTLMSLYKNLGKPPLGELAQTHGFPMS